MSTVLVILFMLGASWVISEYPNRKMKERIRLLQIEENKKAVEWAKKKGYYVVPPPIVVEDVSGWRSDTMEGWQPYIEENK